MFEMDAELFLKLLGGLAAALLMVWGGIVGLIHLLRRMGLDTRRKQREDSVDSSSTESALSMLKETRAELERAYKSNRELDERAGSGMQRELALTRKLAVSEGNVDRLRRTLDLVNKQQKELVEAGQLADPLVDRLTEIIIDTSGNQ